MRNCIVISFFVLLLLSTPAFGAEVDNSLYANVLEKYVKNGLVDYDGLKAHPGDLDSYLTMMGQVQPDELSEKSQLAFYINLYNAATLQLILAKYPLKTIKEIGGLFSSPWKLKVVLLDGKMVSLDHIEHDIIRPTFGDPRVHFALNCSAISCPPLAGEPYEGDMLDLQLNLATEMFINDRKSNYLSGETLYISKIFDWFGEDFPRNFVKWFTRYTRGTFKSDLQSLSQSGKGPHIQYLKYDWSLNRQPQ